MKPEFCRNCPQLLLKFNFITVCDMVKDIDSIKVEKVSVAINP